MDAVSALLSGSMLLTKNTESQNTGEEKVKGISEKKDANKSILEPFPPPCLTFFQ